jgi:hypothetical protein
VRHVWKTCGVWKQFLQGLNYSLGWRLIFSRVNCSGSISMKIFFYICGKIPKLQKGINLIHFYRPLGWGKSKKGKNLGSSGSCKWETIGGLSWRNMYVSLGGRVVLLNLVLGSILIHYMFPESIRQKKKKFLFYITLECLKINSSNPKKIPTRRGKWSK